MFVTQELHRFEMPEGLSEPHASYWPVVQLHMRTSWFLLTLRLQVEGLDLLRSFAVSSAHVLREVLRTLEPDRVAALACVMPDEKPGAANWHSRAIDEIYEGTTSQGTVVLLFADEAGEDFVDDIDAGAADDVSQWRLVLKLSPVPALGG